MYNTSQNYKDKVLNDSTLHELNIYIDGNKIEPDHIIDFSSTLELFNNNEFCLGCTPEIDIEFEIDKRDLPENYNEVYVESGLEDEIIPIIIKGYNKENYNLGLSYMDKYSYGITLPAYKNYLINNERRVVNKIWIIV